MAEFLDGESVARNKYRGPMTNTNRVQRFSKCSTFTTGYGKWDGGICTWNSIGLFFHILYSNMPVLIETRKAPHSDVIDG
jgi:hypothetical protein